MKLSEILEMEAGPELDKIVSKIFGFQPQTDWRVMNSEHTAYCISFDFYSEAKEWWDKNKERYRIDDPQCNFYKYDLVEWETWPRVSEDVSSVWKVEEKMKSMKTQYIYWLSRQIEQTGSASEYTFDIAHALPVVKCRAAIAAALQERGELEETIYQCPFCDQKWTVFSYFMKHLREHAEEIKRMREEPICQECGFPPDDCICFERWILVEKELPPLRTAFWVWDGKTVDENRLGRNNKDDDIYRKYLQSRGITHWMLRIKPQPPEEEVKTASDFKCDLCLRCGNEKIGPCLNPKKG
jgi:hypothetical protein